MRHANVRNVDEVDVREMIKGRHNMRVRQLGKPAGSIELGATLTEVAPGGISFRRHAHYVNEEAIYVLSGCGEARIGDTGADFAGIGILHNLCPTHRRDTEIDERLDGRDIDHLMRVLGAGRQRDPVPRPHRDACIADPRLSGTGEDIDRFFVDVMGVTGKRDSTRCHLSQCRAEGNAAGGLAELTQVHVVPAFDHFADFDFVGIAYVCVSHHLAESPRAT